MKRALSTLCRRSKDLLRSDAAAVLVVTASVQGLVVGAQLLAAFVVDPDRLGQIRWLESVFAIALLAASLGMPSIAFREAALVHDARARARLLVEATGLSAAGGLLAIAVCAVVAVFFVPATSADTWMLLLAMSGVLVPANGARIAIAVVHGTQRAREHAPRLLVLSAVGVLALAGAAAWAGPEGWIAARFVVEAAMAGMLFRALLSGGRGGRPALMPRLASVGRLLKAGLVANYGFMMRVLADNLPILLMQMAARSPTELGLFGLASLVLFAPVLLLSVTMQARLPDLIKSVADERAFSEGLTAALRALLRSAILWALALILVAICMHWRLILPEYRGAAIPLALLGASLPARATVLTAGGAAIAHGRFALPSVLALIEIAVVTAAYLLGATDAVHLALAVAVAQAVAVLPSVLLLRGARAASAAQAVRGGD